MRFYSEKSYHDGTLTIIKAKCARVICEEVNKAVNDDVAWSSREVVPVAFHNNVFMGLDLSLTTRAVSGEVREESLSAFPNRGMSSSHAGETGT